MRSVIAVILGGGRGERLQPLTDSRAKPAVPIAGKYRLVDVPISNCLHAGIERMYVLTQYQSASLNRHVTLTYRFDAFSAGHVTVLAAEQTPEGSYAQDWYAGTADAVRKQLHRLHAKPDDQVLILSGDQVYTMDLARLVYRHRAMGADVTIAATRCTREDARRFGVMRVDSDGWIQGFAEKPQEAAVLDAFVVPDPLDELTHLASMGIYVFQASVLERLLADDDREDFGKHILPSCVGRERLAVYPFVGYWEDVGTIESFHRVALELTDSVPAFNLFNEDRPIYTRARFLPPAKIGRARIDRCLLAEGAIIGDDTEIVQSVIGIRTVISPGCTLRRVVAAGAGTYALEDHLGGDTPLGIGPGSTLHNVIIDRDARIGRGVRLVNERGLREYSDDYIVVRDGIIVVAARGVVPDGYTF